MNKKEILSNLDYLQAEQLLPFVKSGIVTLEELMAEGLPISVRRRLSQLSLEEERREVFYWDEMKLRGLTGYKEYLEKFPNGKFSVEAKERIREEEDAEQERRKKKDEILLKIRNNANAYTPGMVKAFIEKHTISEEDLLHCQVPQDIIGMLRENIASPELDPGEPPDEIPDGCTEVYFWGTPGSGKTCALSAIIHSADRNAMLEVPTGSAYDYAYELKNLFDSETAILPSPTNVEKAQYLPFELRCKNRGGRSIALIEVSGEIFECFFTINAGRKFEREQHQDGYDKLMRFLNSKNRKIHFFFIDYEREGMKDKKGRFQVDYLTAAATFFEKSDIFKGYTDGIFLVVTKSDLMVCEPEERFQKCEEYLISKYPGFIRILRDKCQKYSINGKRLESLPFSLGDVYFKWLCKLDYTDSNAIIDILFRIAKRRKGGFWNVLRN